MTGPDPWRMVLLYSRPHQQDCCHWGEEGLALPYFPSRLLYLVESKVEVRSWYILLYAFLRLLSNMGAPSFNCE